MQASDVLLDDSWHFFNSPLDEMYEIENPFYDRFEDYIILNSINDLPILRSGLDGDPDNGGEIIGGGNSSGSDDGLEGEPGDDFISGIKRGPIGNGVLPILFLASVYLFFIVKKEVFRKRIEMSK